MNQCVIPTCDVPTRWSSTYLMIKRCIQLQVVIGMYLSSDASLKKNNIKSVEWDKIIAMANLLKPLYDATNYLSMSKYSTLGATLYTYDEIIKVSLISKIFITNITSFKLYLIGGCRKRPNSLASFSTYSRKIE